MQTTLEKRGGDQPLDVDVSWWIQVAASQRRECTDAQVEVVLIASFASILNGGGDDIVDAVVQITTADVLNSHLMAAPR